MERNEDTGFIIIGNMAPIKLCPLSLKYYIGTGQEI